MSTVLETFVKLMFIQHTKIKQARSHLNYCKEIYVWGPQKRQNYDKIAILDKTSVESSSLLHHSIYL